MSHQYPAEVFWSDEDDGFIALARDLPGCSAFGETRLEALDELERAVEAWLAAARAAGNPIPAPRRPDQAYSGKLLVRLPRTLHGKLARQAEMEGVSLNHYVVSLLAENNNSHAIRQVVVEAAKAMGRIAYFQVDDVTTRRLVTGPELFSTNVILTHIKQEFISTDNFVPKSASIIGE